MQTTEPKRKIKKRIKGKTNKTKHLNPEPERLHFRPSGVLLVQLQPQVLDLTILGNGEAARISMRQHHETPVGRSSCRCSACSTRQLHGPCSAWRSCLVRGFIREAKDPEQHLADCLRDRCRQRYSSVSIFPVIPSKASATDFQSHLRTGGHVN